MSDADQLKEMGFNPERIPLALKAGGNLLGAIEWLENNADRDIEELKAEAAEGEIKVKPAEGDDAAVAHSYVCGECGKKFRNMTEVQFHANKSGHSEISESVEEIAPLTAEEKQQKLADLRAKLAAKKAQQSEADKEEKKRNEQIRTKATKESQDIREQLKAKEQIKEAEQKRREKKEDQLAKQKVLAQIKADKEERRLRAAAEKAAREGKPVPVEEPKPIPAQTAASSSRPAHTDARLRLQTPAGTLTKTFPAETTLFEVAHALREEHGFDAQKFSTTFPTKHFEATEFGMTLKEAGMVPSAVVIVQ